MMKNVREYCSRSRRSGASVKLERKLREAGHTLVVFDDSMRAFEALISPQPVQILITGIVFPAGKPHGVALANAAGARRPSLKVIYLASPDLAPYLTSDATVFFVPVFLDKVVEAVSDLCSGKPVSR